MKRQIAIQLGEAGRPLGLLRYDQQGAREGAAFEYTAEWLAAADRFVIDPALPLVHGPQFLRGRGTSLGGLRPKCSVIDDDGHLAIGKFPSVADERCVTKGEVLALRLAAKAGINAAQARIVDSDGVPVALIRRFDRTQSGQRLMYVSAATMLGVESTSAAEHSYTDIVDALRRYGSQPVVDTEELWRRIGFFPNACVSSRHGSRKTRGPRRRSRG